MNQNSNSIQLELDLDSYDIPQQIVNIALKSYHILDI